MITVHLFSTVQAAVEHLCSLKSETVNKSLMKWKTDSGDVHIAKPLRSQEDVYDLMAYRPDAVVIHGWPWPLVKEALIEMHCNKAAFIMDSIL